MTGVVERRRRSDDQAVRAGDAEQHHRSVERSNRGEGVAFERVDVEMSHDIVLPVTAIRTIPVDANSFAGTVPISFTGG